MYDTEIPAVEARDGVNVEEIRRRGGGGATRKFCRLLVWALDLYFGLLLLDLASCFLLPVFLEWSPISLAFGSNLAPALFNLAGAVDKKSRKRCRQARWLK